MASLPVRGLYSTLKAVFSTVLPSYLRCELEGLRPEDGSWSRPALGGPDGVAPARPRN